MLNIYRPQIQHHLLSIHCNGFKYSKDRRRCDLSLCSDTPWHQNEVHDICDHSSACIPWCLGCKSVLYIAFMFPPSQPPVQFLISYYRFKSDSFIEIHRNRNPGAFFLTSVLLNISLYAVLLHYDSKDVEMETWLKSEKILSNGQANDPNH